SFVATYGITYSDYDRFAKLMEEGFVTRMVPMRIFPQEIRYLGKLHNGRVVATTPEHADVNQLDMMVAHFLTDEDDLRMKNVCVIASNVAASLFPYEDPLGKTVRLNSHFYKVVGVIQERMPTGGTGGSQAAEDYNHDVYIPLQTCKVRFGE